MTRAPSSLRSKLLWPTVASACGVALLLNLGVWQLRRLEEKTVLLTKITSRVNQPPIDIPAESTWPGLAIADLEYAPAKASGTFMHEDEALVFEPAAKGETGLATKGFAVLTPLKLDDGRIIIVDRGFVPENLGPVERSLFRENCAPRKGAVPLPLLTLRPKAFGTRETRRLLQMRSASGMLPRFILRQTPPQIRAAGLKAAIPKSRYPIAIWNMR